MGDLTVFEGLPKMSWGERKQLISEQFPSVDQLDWVEAFNDVELFGRLLRDILKFDQSEPGRSGPRPVLDRKVAEKRLRQFMRIDHSELPFKDSLAALAGNRSIRHLATNTGIHRNTIQRLLAGTKEPTIPLMEQIAKGMGKEPSYFLEYRIAYILAAMESRMMSSPEIVGDLYNRLRPRNKQV